MAIKLDMSKAFDRVEWVFIEGMMWKLGFFERWISLVMRCISYVSYSFLLNGNICGNICAKAIPSLITYSCCVLRVSLAWLTKWLVMVIYRDSNAAASDQLSPIYSLRMIAYYSLWLLLLIVY